MGCSAAAVLFGIAGFALYFRAGTATPPEIRLDIVTPPTNSPASFALSPDGRKIAYVATTDGVSRLWVRSLDSISGQALPGTEDALYPFWSPDGRSLGFFAGGKLKSIDVAGGLAQTLAEWAAAQNVQGAWSAAGTILFNPNITGPLLQVPATGGKAIAATRPGKGDTAHLAPRFLPDGRRFLFASLGAAPALWMGSLDEAAKGNAAEPRSIAALTPGDESPGEYLTPGWLVRVRANVLAVQRFDAASGQLSGDPVTLAQAVDVDPYGLAGSFSVAASSTGQGNGATIAWRSGGSRRQLTWSNRSGQNVEAFGTPDASNLQYPEISAYGNRVMVEQGPATLRDIWMREGARTTRFTFDRRNSYPIWSPDGKSVVFGSNRKGTSDLYQKPADGSGSEELLLQSGDTKRPNSWSPDGRFILYWSPQNNGDLMVLPVTGTESKSGDRKPYPFLSTPFDEQQGVFSPDGKWVAYQSNESGRDEVYVRSFPGPGGQSQISAGGGSSPRWRADGKELYYIAPDKKLMAVAVVARNGALVPGSPEALFQTHLATGTGRQQYDVARDGRFLIVTDLQDAFAAPIHVLLNWRPPAK